MEIKKDIKNRAGLQEASTYKLGGIELSKDSVDVIKQEAESAIEDVAKTIQREINKKDKHDMSYSEANKEAQIFITNYLKGVLGK